MSRLIAIICGRRSKYLVVAFWIVVVAALGSLSGKLQGAELNVYIGGPAASAADELEVFKGIDSPLLFAALGVVIGLLLLTYRSPVLWLLPIISAAVSLTIAEAVIYLLIQHANLTVNGQSGGILVVLVIGASTDYALLLIARYREELRRHADRHEAMAVALRRAGPAIIASGLTVVTGMFCLLAAESNEISGLGPVAAVGIAVGLIAMITLLPALLVVFGRWMFWPVRPGYRSVLVTALTLDIGRHMWWPSALANPESSPVTDGT
jgi:RND superfamily putative drug exporter